MKADSFEKWDINSSTMPVLFFVQSMEEMLFHYGHDSYKVPTLNFHYLCVEIYNSIQKMEQEIMDKGNMRPLYDELKEMYLNDYIARKLYGTNFQELFFMKDDKGDYSRDFSKLQKDPGSDISIKRIKRTVRFLIDDMMIQDKYFETLKTEIKESINNFEFNVQNCQKLSALSRVLLTELINRGYSQEYIYSQIKERYYSGKHEIKDVSTEITYFLNLFDFQMKKYKVTFPVKKRDAKKLLELFENIEVSENKNGLFGNSSPWIVGIEIESLEPEDARRKAHAVISLCVSLKQYNSHTNKTFYANQAIVKDLETGKDYYLKKPALLLLRERGKTEQQTYARIAEIINSFPVIGDKMINAINLHTSAMEDQNVSNQLLNLWTIIEVLIEVDKKNSYVKITQISNALTTVLNASYIKSLIEQLLFDLKHCCCEFNDYLSEEVKGKNEIEKMIALLVLPEYAQNKQRLEAAIYNYPLLRYRIEHYAEQFSDRSKVKNVLEKHRKRLEWQIMRIYRNRNMIVHDGSHFPYIDLIVQNLHFYVDNLIDTIIFYIGKGYSSLEVVYSILSHYEFEHQLLLEKKDNNKKPLQLGDDFNSVVLGFSYIE